MYDVCCRLLVLCTAAMVMAMTMRYGACITLRVLDDDDYGGVLSCMVQRMRIGDVRVLPE